MKKVFTLLSFIFVLINFSFSQVNAIKDYPLRDYIAPDIKYRLFDLGTSLNLNGFQGTSDNKTNGFSTNLNLNYYQYINTSRFQGISDVRSNNYYRYSNNEKNDTSKQTGNNLRVDLNYYGQNRFYIKEDVFLGLNGFVTFNNAPINKETGTDNYEAQNYSFKITPYLSGGKGRIQPVQSARKAMDILMSLEKCNRLAILPDSLMIDSLAQVANRIRYKRFYDIRLKDIYQLEQLDHAIQAMNLIDTADIVYFANLNDIWNFTQNFNRGSGIRYEGGIIPFFSIFNYKSMTDGEEDVFDSNHNWYGVFGFFSFNRMRPINYAWQSDFMVDLTFGINSEDWKSEYDGQTNEINQTSLSGIFNASWQFGYYPNTRTYLGLTPYTAVSFVSDTDFSDDEFGLNTGLLFNSYYYVSPRLRLLFEAQFFYAKDFNWTTPSPFWNNPTYNQTSALAMQYTNDVVTRPIDAFHLREKYSYSFMFYISYAIF